MLSFGSKQVPRIDQIRKWLKKAIHLKKSARGLAGEKASECEETTDSTNLQEKKSENPSKKRGKISERPSAKHRGTRPCTRCGSTKHQRSTKKSCPKHPGYVGKKKISKRPRPDKHSSTNPRGGKHQCRETRVPAQKAATCHNTTQGPVKCHKDVSKPVEQHSDIGRRIRVYFTVYKKWFAGMISGWDNTAGKFHVLYDDGESWWHDLQKEKIAWE
jgi:hypothetical protein